MPEWGYPSQHQWSLCPAWFIFIASINLNFNVLMKILHISNLQIQFTFSVLFLVDFHTIANFQFPARLPKVKSHSISYGPSVQKILQSGSSSVGTRRRKLSHLTQLLLSGNNGWICLHRIRWFYHCLTARLVVRQRICWFLFKTQSYTTFLFSADGNFWCWRSIWFRHFVPLPTSLACV